MNRSKQRLHALITAALLVAASACASDDGASESPTTADAVTTDAASVDTSASSTEPGVDPADVPEGRGAVTENADGTRTVTSSYGTAVVPGEPRRIVSVVGDIDFEAMLALGVRPVGAGTQGGTVASGFAPHLEGLVEGIEPLPWADGSPTEAIAALEPDLIFVPDADTAALLANIAPVVPRGTWVGTDWKADFLYVGEVLGRADEAATMLAAYEADAAEVRTELAPIIDGTTALSPQTAWDHSQVYVDSDDSFSGAVLTELGFELAPLAYDDDPDGIGVSFEQLELIDADYLFWQVRQDDEGAPDTEGLEIVRSNPLYPLLPAVAADQAFEVPNRPWYFPSILGARQILDDVRTHLLVGADG